MAEFLKRILTVFFDWVIPASKEANPKCMTKTKHVANKSQRLWVVKESSAKLLSTPQEFEHVKIMIKEKAILLKPKAFIIFLIKFTLI